MTRVFVRTKFFDKQAQKAGINEESIRKFEEYLMKKECTDGTHITSNIWKTRWNKSGTGKSGGVRIYYFDFKEISHTFLLLLYAKSEKENLTESELQELKAVVQEIKNECIIE